VFVFIGCTRLAGSDYPMDTKFLTLSQRVVDDDAIASRASKASESH